MRFLSIIIIIGFLMSHAFTQNIAPKFSHYPAVVFRGKIHRPAWIRHAKGGESLTGPKKSQDLPK